MHHSLNVLDALRGILHPFQKEDGAVVWEYEVAGKIVATIPDESVILVALLHDICKTYFYGTSTRNTKVLNPKTGKKDWKEVPFYTVEDRMPLGHGDKSAMIVKEYIRLETPEMYAIWWHMGAEDNPLQFYQAVEKYPFIWAVHSADVMASHFMETDTGNREMFNITAAPAGEWADNPATEDPEAPPDFQEAPPLEPGA